MPVPQGCAKLSYSDCSHSAGCTWTNAQTCEAKTAPGPMTASPIAQVTSPAPTKAATQTAAPSAVCKGCFCSGLCQRRQQLQWASKCVSTTLDKRLRIVFRFAFGKKVNAARFREALQKYISCMEEAWIRITTVVARSLRSLASDDRDSLVVELDVPAGSEGTADTGTVLRKMLLAAERDASFDEFAIDAATDVTPAPPAAGPPASSSSDDNSGAGAVAGVVLGVLSFCGIAAFAAVYTKKRQAARPNFTMTELTKDISGSAELANDGPCRKPSPVVDSGSL